MDIRQVLGNWLNRSAGAAPVTAGEIDRLVQEHPELDGELRKLRLIVQATSPPGPRVSVGANEETLLELPDYTLLRLLGCGGFGQVWLGRNRHTSRLHAVKVVRTARKVELIGLRAYQQRVRGHPSLLTIEHVGTTAAVLYYTMPLADNAAAAGPVVTPEAYEPLTLQRQVHRLGALPAREVLALAADLAAALHHLHGVGLVHRDVKPANVLRLGGAWVLGDLGLTTEWGPAATEAGTRAFWPPEGPGSPAADLYALGLTLWLAWTGSSSVPPPRPLPEVSDPVGRALRAILERACHTDPKARYRSAAELLDAIATARTPRRWLPKHRMAAAAVVLVSLACAALFLLRSQQPNPTAREQETLQARLELTVFKSEGGAAEWRPLEAPGILPVRRGDQIRIRATLTEPAYVYLLWYDSQGKIIPLFPWNEDRVEVDLTTAPPTRPPRRELVSPTSEYKSWQIDEYPGQETVLLLARHQAATADYPWTDLMGQLSPRRLAGRPQLPDPGLLAEFSQVGPHRGIEKTAQEGHPDLAQLLDRLRHQFDSVRAVRFAHQ